jgi:hypothetical protein
VEKEMGWSLLMAAQELLKQNPFVGASPGHRLKKETLNKYNKRYEVLNQEKQY